jgi:thymidylate synthase
MVMPEVIREDSRNGAVRVWPGPVTTLSVHPMNRVLFNPLRNANPFFHLMESLWMLAGRNDLPWLAQYNKQMATYSDDGGQTQPAAYGFRWREYFGIDQIDAIVQELKVNPGTRRCVLSMWNPGGERDNDILVGVSDLYAAINGSKDVPCNTQCFFTLRDGALHMAVTCRSNDLLWGAHGANAVHFSILLEYIAARVGVAVGTMTQFSWNYHLYEGVLKHDIMDVKLAAQVAYETGHVKPTPIFSTDTMDQFEEDLPVLLEHLKARNTISHNRRFETAPRLRHKFLREVAEPMARVWDYYRVGDLFSACQLCHSIDGGKDGDWKLAATQYMRRAFDKHQ